MSILCIFYLFMNRSMDTSEASDAVDYLDTVSSDIVLFADFDYGSYCEYRGYPSYIDSRAEVFFQSLNEKFDYFNEYYQLEHGRLSGANFTSKYAFTHILVQQGSYYDMYLRNDTNYEIVFHDSNFILYQRKSN